MGDPTSDELDGFLRWLVGKEWLKINYLVEIDSTHFSVGDEGVFFKFKGFKTYSPNFEDNDVPAQFRDACSLVLSNVCSNPEFKITLASSLIREAGEKIGLEKAIDEVVTNCIGLVKVYDG